jgi:hypothetical protein
MHKLNLFLSVNNIVKTRLKARFENGSGLEQRSHESKKKLQVKKPLFKFLWILTLEEYNNELENAKKYIESLEKEYAGKPTFYNYSEMIKKIDEKLKYLQDFFYSAKPPFKRQDMESMSINGYIQFTNKKNITVEKKIIIQELKDYLFGFCALKQTDIDSIAVF